MQQRFDVWTMAEIFSSRRLESRDIFRSCANTFFLKFWSLEEQRVPVARALEPHLALNIGEPRLVLSYKHYEYRDRRSLNPFGLDFCHIIEFGSSMTWWRSASVDTSCRWHHPSMSHPVVMHANLESMNDQTMDSSHSCEADDGQYRYHTDSSPVMSNTSLTPVPTWRKASIVLTFAFGGYVQLHRLIQLV